MSNRDIDAIVENVVLSIQETDVWKWCEHQLLLERHHASSGRGPRGERLPNSRSTRISRYAGLHGLSWAEAQEELEDR
jgi:hypothetical protein